MTAKTQLTLGLAVSLHCQLRPVTAAVGDLMFLLCWQFSVVTNSRTVTYVVQLCCVVPGHQENTTTTALFALFVYGRDLVELCATAPLSFLSGTAPGVVWCGWWFSTLELLKKNECPWTGD